MKSALLLNAGNTNVPANSAASFFSMEEENSDSPKSGQLLTCGVLEHGTFTKRPGRWSLTMRYKGHNKRDNMALASPWRSPLHQRFEQQHINTKFYNRNVHWNRTCQTSYHLACLPSLVLRPDVSVLDYDWQNKKNCDRDNQNRGCYYWPC
jgi:hypothetical protein